MASKTKVEIVEELDEHDEMNPLFEMVRKVLLAGIGAVALGKEEIEDFVDRLVERGEIAEKDGRKLVREVMERRKKEARKAEDELNKNVETVLDKMNVPSKADIEALSEKITALSKKIDELKKS
ncbi:MAG: phasin family protein [Anaerolineales bacterium]|nr:phasin family protein [Anaerolineales bacterium]